MSVIRIPIVARARGSSLLYKPKIPVSRMKWYSPNTCPLPIPKEKKLGKHGKQNSFHQLYMSSVIYQ